MAHHRQVVLVSSCYPVLLNLRAPASGTRKIDGKRGTDPDPAFDCQCPAMFSDDLMRSGETKTGPIARTV